MRSLRQVLAEPGAAFGAWCGIDNAFVAELIGRAAFDWVCIDMQHSHVSSSESLMSMVHALNATDTPVLVRVPWKNDFSAIMSALDAGAQGIIVPMIDTPEEAHAAAAACRYPPRGNRSWGPVRVALEIEAYTPALANDLVVCLVMIETVGGCARIDEILDTPGVDGAYIGPADLTISHGGAPPFTSANPLVVELAGEVLGSCRRRGSIAGFHGDGPLEAVRWATAGFRMVNLTADTSLLVRGAADALEQVRGSR